MLSEKNDFQEQKLWKRLQRVAAAPGGRTRLDPGERKQQPQGQTGERGFPWTEVLVPPKDYEGGGEKKRISIQQVLGIGKWRTLCFSLKHKEQ